MTRLIVPAIAVGLGIFLLLQAAFRSWRLAIVAFAMLPIALVGGELAGLIDGGALSIGSLLGLLAVLGIAARQTVSLFTHYERMLERGESAFGSALVVRGAGDRLAPVVVAAVATAAALAPFLFLGGAAGGEVVQPMAVVVIGGLVTSTLLVLLVGPGAYARFAAAREPAAPTEPDILGRRPGAEAPTDRATEPERGDGAPTERSGAVGAGVDKEEGE